MACFRRGCYGGCRIFYGQADMKWVKSKVRVRGRIYDGEALKPKKRMQFSQKICVFSCIFIVAIWFGNFLLAWFDKPQIPEAISVGFTIFGGFVTGGYFALSGYRDGSLNKLKAKLSEDESEN